jgi:hypothetical protein
MDGHGCGGARLCLGHARSAISVEVSTALQIVFKIDGWEYRQAKLSVSVQ